MQRFKTGDRVLILPKFAHLYPEPCAIVIDVSRDPFRPVFNEYTLEFSDRTKGDLFEFQLLERRPEYQLAIATLALDSYQDKEKAAAGNARQVRHVVLQTQTVEVEIKIHPRLSGASIFGQVMERSKKRLIGDAGVMLLRESTPLLSVSADSSGAFKFDNIASGTLNIDILVQPDLLRILGSFSV